MKYEVKKRHGFWNKLLNPIISYFILKRKFNYTCEKSDLKPPFIVLGNHTTDYDAFFIAKSFNTPLYFVMSDHISSMKVGKFIQHVLCPIPITKSTHDVSTVRNIMSIVRQGGAIGLFPEGNKSFAGEMSEMKPAIGKLLKRLRVPVVIYNIEGGYFSSPRWTHNKRKGEMHGFIKKIITPEEIDTMDNDQLYEIVKENLRVNAYEVQEKQHIRFKGKNLAENIETLLYLCPKCKGISTLKGEKNTFTCSKCGFSANYNEYGYIENHTETRLDMMDKWQKEELRKMPFDKFNEHTLITSDEGFEIKRKIDKYKNEDLGTFRLELYKNAFELVNKKESHIIPFDKIIGYAIEGINGIQLSLKDGKVYRFKNKNSVSGLKYVNFYCALSHLPYHF